MVTVDLGDDAPARIRLAAGMADRFGAALIGVAAAEIELPVSQNVGVAAELIRERKVRATADLQSAKAMFLKEVGNRRSAIWLQALGGPEPFVASNSCLADIVVVRRCGPDDPAPGRMGFSPGGLIMSAGRPVLVVPPGVDDVVAKRILIAWKETREARRVLADALPFLTRAEEVTLVLIGSGIDRQDAELPREFLRYHGIEAEVVADRRSHQSSAASLMENAVSAAADLIVAGGYGHSRLREWAFGGMTLALLENSRLCCLFSH